MSMESLSVEARLLALETRIGLAPKTEGSNNASEKTDIDSRLSALEDGWKSSTSSAFQKMCDESDRLLEDLQPGAGLTYQQELSGSFKNYPMLYRKQLVLASKDSLGKDMKQLSDILNLLYISQKSSIKDDVTQAPILQTPPVTPEQERRVDTLRMNATDCQRQAAEIANHMDSLIGLYQEAMLSLSDRVIRLDEKIKQQGEKRGAF